MKTVTLVSFTLLCVGAVVGAFVTSTTASDAITLVLPLEVAAAHAH